jgi:uncharacterized phage protein (TIGR01671 family)
MNDRFKFRVWDKERKCFFNDDEVVIYPNGEESFFNADYDFTECVVEQCTGLKDKNGKLIYEGDIVKTNFDRDAVIGVISWCGKELRYYLNTTDYFDNKYVTDYEIYQTENYEVIGNIHENADLLENNND